jgi:hypothetical protein
MIEGAVYPESNLTISTALYAMQITTDHEKRIRNTGTNNRMISASPNLISPVDQVEYQRWQKHVK